MHWAFRNDKVKTPLGKLAKARGRELPQHFELSIVATGKRCPRTVNGQGGISFKRYRLFVHADLKNYRVEIREFFDSLVVTYRSGTVVSYPCSHCESQIIEIENTPVFHHHPAIEHSTQLLLFDLSAFKCKYVIRRKPNRKRPKFKTDVIQLELHFGKPSRR